MLRSFQSLRNFTYFYQCIGDGSELYVKSGRNDFDVFVKNVMEGKGTYFAICENKSYFLKFQDKYQASEMLDKLKTDESITVRFALRRLRKF